MSGLRETLFKRYIVERTNKAGIRPEEQSEKAESCQENLWNEIQLKGTQRQKQTWEQNKKEWASSIALRQKHKLPHPPPRDGEPTGTLTSGDDTVTESATHHHTLTTITPQSPKLTFHRNPRRKIHGSQYRCQWAGHKCRRCRYTDRDGTGGNPRIPHDTGHRYVRQRSECTCTGQTARCRSCPELQSRGSYKLEKKKIVYDWQS